MNIFDTIQQTLRLHLQNLFSLTPEQTTPITIEINDDPKKQNFGDLSTNAALTIAKLIGENPRTVAQKIVSSFKHDAIEKTEIAGPGFINLFLTHTAFTDLTQEIFIQKSDFFKLDPEAKKLRYNVEFVSANPTGPLHLGHGRGGILGDVLGNILKFIGHHVTKEFYINDAGAQIQKLGNSFKIRCQQQLGIPAELPEDGYQGEYLVALAQEAITHHKKEVERGLELDELDFFSTYAKDYLLGKLKETLSNYGIQYDVWFSEKVLHIDGAVEAALIFLQEKNYAYIHEDALWFKSTAFGDDKDRVLKRSNGEVTYVAADVAYLQNKIARGYDKIIMILGQDHHSYVQRMKALMEALGHNPADLDVILYQLVTLKEDGEQLRMSKRAGRIVSLEDVTETVGADVARFFYLNRKADAHLSFDIELALKRTEENPVYYIQYAYVRINSVLAKAYEHEALQHITAADCVALDDEEKVLLKKLCNLKVLLNNMSHNYQVHLLTYYALELAHLFHSYYGSHKVIDLDAIATSRSRLALLITLHRTLKLCMELLGISCPEKM
jgi:arginyl-tRNA synthetase